MENMELFVTKPTLSFDKVAGTALSEDPGEWPRQILTELYRSTPEVSDYMPQVAMIKIDEEQGYGYGVVIVSNATNSALSATAPNDSTKRILIPVVIKNYQLCPLDLIMARTGKMMPLNAHRLREALFRPETFEMITDDWGDTTLYNMFYPPGRSDNDFGAGISQGISGGTQGAVTVIQGPGMKLGGDFTVLRSILPTIMAPDVERVAKVASDIAAAGSKAFLGGLSVIAEAESGALKSAEAVMHTALDTAGYDVVQLGYVPDLDAYYVKKASRKLFREPGIQVLDRGDFLKFAGAEVLKRVDTDGVVTIAESIQQKTAESTWISVDQPGIYKVKTVHGKEMTGWVIPNLLDLSGETVPMSLFTNGAAAIVQGEIAGARVATGVDLPSAAPKGTGCFYTAGQGGVVATVPLMILGSEASMDGMDCWLCKSLTGEATKVCIVPGIQTMAALDGEFMLPASAKFLPLDEENMVPLIGEPEAAVKTAAEVLSPVITVFGNDGDTVELRYNNMPKLASAYRTKLSLQDAAMVLCLAGTSAAEAYTHLAQAQRSGVKVAGLSDIGLASDLIQQTKKIAEESSGQIMKLRRYLVKEAAALPNAMTVDAVLSLGFVNSENVRMYISRLPHLEACLSSICELILGSRVGLTEIPEYAAARSARGLDEVIQGLKALALRDTKDPE